MTNPQDTQAPTSVKYNNSALGEAVQNITGKKKRFGTNPVITMPNDFVYTWTVLCSLVLLGFGGLQDDYCSSLFQGTCQLWDITGPHKLISFFFPTLALEIYPRIVQILLSIINNHSYTKYIFFLETTFLF